MGVDMLVESSSSSDVESGEFSSIIRKSHKEEHLDFRATQKPPEDSFLLGYIAFIILGMGILFPWNTFLTSSDYFDGLYPHFPYDFIVSLAFNYPSVIMLIVSVKWGSKVSFTSRILFSFIIDLVVLVTIPLISKFFPKTVALSLTFFGVFLTGISTAILFGAVMGMAALFPPQYIGGVMAGNGWAGIVPAILRIITKAALPGDKKGLQESATTFFVLCAFVILICIICQILIVKLPFAKFYLHNINHRHVAKDDEDEESSLLHKTPESQEQKSPSIIKVFKQIWDPAFLVFFVFFVTLSLFPGVTSLIDSHDPKLGKSWFQLILVTIFMVGDLTGRTLPKWFTIFSRKALWIPVLSRVIFFPLFIFCIKVEIFQNNYIAFTFMFLFAISNGYTSTLAMMYGGTTESLCDHEREMAGTQMSFFLNFGIFAAIHFAFLLLYAITGSIGL